MSAGIIPVTDEHTEYLYDESKTAGYADAICFPANEEELRSILKSGSYRKITVQGSRTGLTAGCVPYGGLVINLGRMNRMTGMRIDDNGTVFVTVQPGLTLGELRRMIAAREFPVAGWSDESLAAFEKYRKMAPQFFPPDPTEPSASIGGMVSCNSSGAKTYRYGATRPYVNAVRLLLADGDLLWIRRGEQFADGRSFSLRTESGCMISGTLPSYTMPACKNACGYYAGNDMDLIDLVIGSDGTLGILSEIELRLLPLPEIVWSIGAFFEYEAEAVEFVKSVRSLPLAAIEYFDRNSLAILRAGKTDSRMVPERFNSMIYLEIHADSEEKAADIVETVTAGIDRISCGSAETRAALTGNERDRLLKLRHDVPESVNALIAERKLACPGLKKVGSDMAVPDPYLDDVIELYRRDLAESGLEYAIWGHIGNNHLHVNVLPRNSGDMIQAKVMFSEWAKKITALGGTVSAEHGIGKNKQNLLAILFGESGLREMAALKRCFDPQCVLSPGNWFPEEYV